MVITVRPGRAGGRYLRMHGSESIPETIDDSAPQNGCLAPGRRSDGGAATWMIAVISSYMHQSIFRYACLLTLLAWQVCGLRNSTTSLVQSMNVNRLPKHVRCM
mmetsp:Transcript_37324/g.92848  ORF Transcript_37324/g.92848 Transcript_37324/m.92848 type:complete len:104 (-) Transcript_37324:33-344(-)